MPVTPAPAWTDESVRIDPAVILMLSHAKLIQQSATPIIWPFAPPPSAVCFRRRFKTRTRFRNSVRLRRLSRWDPAELIISTYLCAHFSFKLRFEMRCMSADHLSFRPFHKNWVNVIFIAALLTEAVLEDAFVKVFCLVFFLHVHVLMHTDHRVSASYWPHSNHFQQP